MDTTFQALVLDQQGGEVTPSLRTLERDALPAGDVLVSVALDGGEPRTFIFDTGAGGTAIDPQLAEQLGLEQVGEQKVASVYDTEMARVVQVQSLSIGPARLVQPRLVTMNLDFVRQMMQDESIVGIIGYDLISQCVCEIELASDSIRLYDSSSFARDLDWMPITFYQNIPLVPARFPQGEGMFRMDVGASSGEAGNVVFHSPVVERLKMVPAGAPTATAGNAEFALGSVEWFELSGHRCEKPRVIFALGDTGPLADPYIDGNIGVEFLRPFRIVFDYRRARMALIPVD